VDPVAVAVAAVLGAAGGELAGRLADAVATPRYGEGTEGYDPEDAALAPLHPPTTAGQRLGLAVLGGAGLAVLASTFADGWTVAYLGVLLVGYLAAMTVDLQYLRLPNLFTYPAAAVAAVGAVLLSAHHDVPVTGAVGGLVVYAGFLWVTRLLYLLVRGREGMGLGDVKLALSLGASAGWLGGLFVDPASIGGVQLAIYAALAGNVIGVVAGLVGGRTLQREVPFGPALVAGWFVVVVFAESLLG
jgi:leader peptidase (prepilin peptidase)/N-methyltransferase